MKHVKLITLLLEAGLAACSSDDGTETPPAPRSMTVEVTENPFIDSETGSRISLSPLRKADATTTSSLNDFSMSYFYKDNLYKYDFTKTNGTWGPTSYIWPGVEGVDDDTSIDFYAYTGNIGYIAEQNKWIFHYESTNPYISFSVDENAFNQHDLLVAQKQTSFKVSKGKVSLEFDHACAAVQFNVQITNTLTGVGYLNGQSLTVNKIRLMNVIKEGDYYYETNSWTPSSKTTDYTDYTLTKGPLTVTTTPMRLPCDYLFLIPQARPADGTTGTYLEVTYTTSSEKTANIPLSIDWKAGFLYTINIKLGTTYIVL